MDPSIRLITPEIMRELGADAPPSKRPCRSAGSRRPEDIGLAALYLASDDANFLTGVVLEVDGGRCI